jgi:hypothetical protein
MRHFRIIAIDFMVFGLKIRCQNYSCIDNELVKQQLNRVKEWLNLHCKDFLLLFLDHEPSFHHFPGFIVGNSPDMHYPDPTDLDTQSLPGELHPI